MIRLPDIDKLSESLTASFHFPLTRIYFLRSIALFLILNYLIFWLPFASDYWGSERFLLPYYKTNAIIFFPLNLLEKFTFDWLWKSFLFLLFPLCIVALIRPLNIWVWLSIYFLHSNLFHGTAALQNAGSNTLIICIFLSLFMLPFPVRRQSLRSLWWNNSINNLAFAMIIFQVLVLYFVASITKLWGLRWTDGTAFYYVLMNDVYSHPFFRSLFSDSNFVVKTVSWFTLCFQLLFPVLVWFRQTKMLFLCIGVFFHLMIVWVMGIEDFGFIMMILYLPFLGEKRIGVWQERFKKTMVFRILKRA